MPTQLFPPRPAVRPVDAAAPVGEPVGPFYRLVATPSSISLGVCRLILGGVMFPHAAQKVFGWFGGPGWSATISAFHGHLGIPTWLAAVAIVVEFIGSIGLILGLFGRVAAAGIAAVMLGAIALVHAKSGFFMNWQGVAPGEGFEYHLLAIGLAVAIIGWGSGAVSIDRALEVRRPHNVPVRD